MCTFWHCHNIWHNNIPTRQAWRWKKHPFPLQLSHILPVAAVGDCRNHGNVLLKSENRVQRAVPRVDKCELVEACAFNTTASIRQPNKTVLKEMWIISDCLLFNMNGCCKSQQCTSICTSLRDLESVTRWIHATHSTDCPQCTAWLQWIKCVLSFCKHSVLCKINLNR